MKNYQMNNDKTNMSEIGKEAWRVEVLDDKTAGKGVFKTYNQRFTLRDEWSGGIFHPQDCCEMPGKAFVAKASGKEGCTDVFLTTGLSDIGGKPVYSFEDGVIYVAWKLQPPKQKVEGGLFSLVRPTVGAWRVWCNGSKDGETVWTVEFKKDGVSQNRQFKSGPLEDGWIDVQLILSAEKFDLELNHEIVGSFEHDPYPGKFSLRFGSGQENPGGEEVASKFRIIYVSDIPYLFTYCEVKQGPEDVRTGDDIQSYFVCPPTLECPRHTEGDLIELKNGNLLLIWSEFHTGKAQDFAPSRISGKISTDRGKTWGATYVVIDEREGRHPTPNVSLIYAENGNLLLTYTEVVAGRKHEGCDMLLRRSKDHGKTWSDSIIISEDTEDVLAHAGKLFCRLSSGRIILSTRGYLREKKTDFGGVCRWPYALYSDDDGYTWKSGAFVPDPGLSERLRLIQNVNEPSIVELADGRLLMTMRSYAGGQFFSYSSDGGESWTKPVLSPLRGINSPATLARIPGSDDILVIWSYGFGGRAPLNSAISSDGGKTWNHLKLVEANKYYSCDYVTITFIDNKAFLTYGSGPLLPSLRTIDVKDTTEHGLRLTVLPIEWFYRKLTD